MSLFPMSGSFNQRRLKISILVACANISPRNVTNSLTNIIICVICNLHFRLLVTYTKTKSNYVGTCYSQREALQKHLIPSIWTTFSGCNLEKFMTVLCWVSKTTFYKFNVWSLYVYNFNALLMAKAHSYLVNFKSAIKKRWIFRVFHFK